MYDHSRWGAAGSAPTKGDGHVQKRIVAAGLTLAALTLAPLSADASEWGNEVRMEDRCEPVSFNAVLGDGACVGNGTTTIDEFFEELNPVDFGDDHWRFQVSGSSIKRGESIQVINKGGEARSFTEVAAFGGGWSRGTRPPTRPHAGTGVRRPGELPRRPHCAPVGPPGCRVWKGARTTSCV